MYNGWTNHATWLVHLYITNTKNIYDEVLDEIDDLPKETARNLRDLIEDRTMVNEYIQRDDYQHLVDDLVISALREVDWYEIAVVLHQTIEEG